MMNGIALRKDSKGRTIVTRLWKPKAAPRESGGNGNLINRSAVKKFILAQVAARRPGWDCRRVSGKAIETIEAKLRAMIIGQIEGHPTLGRTFNP